MAIINIVIRIRCQILLPATLRQRRRILMIMQIKSTFRIRGYVRRPPVWTSDPNHHYNLKNDSSCNNKKNKDGPNQDCRDDSN